MFPFLTCSESLILLHAFYPRHSKSSTVRNWFILITENVKGAAVDLLARGLVEEGGVEGVFESFWGEDCSGNNLS